MTFDCSSVGIAGSDPFGFGAFFPMFVLHRQRFCDGSVQSKQSCLRVSEMSSELEQTRWSNPQRLKKQEVTMVVIHINPITSSYIIS